MSKYTSCPNFVQIVNFWESDAIFYFQPIYKDIGKVSSFAKALKFCYFTSYMMQLKVAKYWGSRKTCSICKAEYIGVLQFCTYLG